MLGKKILIALNVVACVALTAMAMKYVGTPIVAKSLFKAEYQELMFQCDNVMREHLIAKNRVLVEKTENSLLQLDAAVGLVTCHDYDVMRKMRIAGVSDQELALIALR